MLDRLIDLIIGALNLFKFWEVIPVYERGLVLRLGKHVRDLEPGLHWIAPMGVDVVLTDNVVSTMTALDEQALVTEDDIQVVAGVVVRWKIVDLAKATLEVESLDSVIVDCAAGVLGQYVRAYTWEDVSHEGFPDLLHEAMAERAIEYGVEIESVQLTQLAKPIIVKLIK